MAASGPIAAHPAKTHRLAPALPTLLTCTAVGSSHGRHTLRWPVRAGSVARPGRRAAPNGLRQPACQRRRCSVAARTPPPRSRHASRLQGTHPTTTPTMGKRDSAAWDGLADGRKSPTASTRRHRGLAPSRGLRRRDRDNAVSADDEAAALGRACRAGRSARSRARRDAVGARARPDGPLVSVGPG